MPHGPAHMGPVHWEFGDQNFREERKVPVEPLLGTGFAYGLHKVLFTVNNQAANTVYQIGFTITSITMTIISTVGISLAMR